MYRMVLVTWRRHIETKSPLYRDAITDCAGLSNRVCAWQTAPGTRVRPIHSAREFINNYSSQVRQMMPWNPPGTQNEGNDADSKNRLSHPTGTLCFP